MCKNGYLDASGENSDIGIWFLDSDFLIDGEISAIWGRFQLICSSDKLKVRHISISSLFDILTQTAQSHHMCRNETPYPI